MKLRKEKQVDSITNETIWESSVTNEKSLVISQTVTINCGGKVRDHSKLTKLDFENSGHTGFASQEELNEIKNKLFILEEEIRQLKQKLSQE